MIFRRMSLACVAVASSFTASLLVAAQDDPVRDMQIGMEGLLKASKDPAMMAQLMQDMQV